MNEAAQPARGKRTIIYAVVAFLAVIVVMYLWKEVSLGLLAKSANAERQELAQQQEQRQQALRQAFDERTTALLELLGTPLGWAVRTEAIQEDYAQIDEYALRLVKEPMVRRVVLVAADGTITIATDKKLQGEPAESFFGDLPSVEDVTIRQNGEDELHLAVPILGYNARLGSLIVTLSREALEPRDLETGGDL